MESKEEPPSYMHYSDDALKLASCISKRLSMLAPDALNYGTVCIYRVPEKHRNNNPQAYTPRLISIGPLHHGNSQLQAMEEYKLKYLSNFLQTFQVPLELLAEYVNTQEKLVCGCYEDFYSHNSDLSEVILLDGVFMVELFLKNHFLEMREMGDVIFDNPWVSNDILRDLLLFENQLPLRYISALYNAFVSEGVKGFLDDNATDNIPSFYQLVQEYFKSVGNIGKLELPRNVPSARHLVEFIAILHMPVIKSSQKRPELSDFSNCASATELLAAGVKFQRAEEKCLFHIDFDGGVLKIPQLTVGDLSETLFRNLIAFEQAGYHIKYITSYVVLLDNLIDTHKDVDILIKHDILRNRLGSSDQVAEVFNNLYKEIVTDAKEFYYAELCSKLNEYRRDILHKWKSKSSKWFAMLGREYFGNPWSIISLIGAILLLLLTVVQAVCSVIQVLQH